MSITTSAELDGLRRVGRLVARALRIMSGRPARWMVVASALTTGACAAIQQVAFQSPTLQLEAVQITGLNLSGGSFDLLLDVYNPNAYDLRTIRIETGIDLEETHFGDVAVDEAYTLPGTGHASVRVPVSFSWLGVGAAARGLLGRGAVAYTLDAQLMLDTPLGEQPAGFRLSGDVPIRELIR